MGKFIGHRQNSRTDWGRDACDGSNPSIADIQLGCLLRIADATEAMAKSYTDMQRSLENYKRWYAEEQSANLILGRRNAALRGVITKLKKVAP